MLLFSVLECLIRLKTDFLSARKYVCVCALLCFGSAATIYLVGPSLVVTVVTFSTVYKAVILLVKDIENRKHYNILRLVPF